MTLNALEAYELIKDPLNLAKPAQVGVDLTVNRIERIVGSPYLDENSKINGFQYIDDLYNEKTGYYELPPNQVFNIVMDQGLEVIPNNMWAEVIGRSSTSRASIKIMSAIFDAGYSVSPEVGITVSLYTFHLPVRIYKHARVAQMIFYRCTPILDENLYKGQWQGKNNDRPLNS